MIKKLKNGNIIRNYISIYGYPKSIGNDNGSEFNNKSVKALLNSNDIKHILRKPNNPHSQGVVERVHRTIRNGIICKYLENKKLFNIENTLNLVVKIYNNTIHRITKYKPLQYISDDENLFKEVKENTLKSFKN